MALHGIINFAVSNKPGMELAGMALYSIIALAGMLFIIANGKILVALFKAARPRLLYRQVISGVNSVAVGIMTASLMLNTWFIKKNTKPQIQSGSPNV